MRYFNLFYCFLFAGWLLVPGVLSAQVTDLAPKTTTRTDEDTMVTIEILPGVRKLEFRKINDSTQLQILAGNVKLKQGKTLFDCDSCVINNNSNIFEAWGHVHINDSDTTNAYSEHLLYFIRKKVAYLDGGVTLTDGKGTLTTPDLEYDVDTKIGIYKNGGKVVNKKSVLTSTEGFYYTDLKDVYFKKNVELKDPAYFIKTDSLLYNTQTGTVRFIAETFIKDSSGRIVQTKEGFYNLQTGKAEFGQRPTIRDGKTVITANRIAIDDSTGVAQAQGNAIIVDSTNQTTILAGIIYRNKKTEAILAIQKPLMIIKQNDDSIFITADTLFSARLTDLYNAKKRNAVIQDTIRAIKGATINNDKDDVIPEGITRTQTLARNKKDSTITDTAKGIKPITVTEKDSVIIDSTKGLKAIIVNKRDSIILDSAKKIKPIAVNKKDAVIPDSVKNAKTVTLNKKDMVTLDTINGTRAININEKDSNNRYVEAYRHVRIFSDSLQAVSDSLFYSFKDSVFRLFQDPVLWSNKSQITGDTVLLYTKNKKADRVKVFNNSFMVNRLDPEIFNQVKSTRMDGYFKEGSIDSVRCSGLAECIYYIQDEDSAYTGINQSKSDILDIYFAKKELRKVVFRSSVTGTIWPIRQKDPKEMRLTGFQWLEARRPKTKFELFE